MGAWAASSSALTLSNKWLLSSSRFPFPLTLALWHALSGALLAWACVWGGWAPCPEPSGDLLRHALPIGALYAGTLAFNNAANMRLSLPAIQYLKALMPCTVYGVGCALGTQRPSPRLLANLLVVTSGVAAASYGAACGGNALCTGAGICFQLASLLTESLRLVLMQTLLQLPDARLASPITALCWVSPIIVVCLLPWWAFSSEAPRLLALRGKGIIGAAPLAASAALAFGLNLSAAALNRRVGALALRLTGIARDVFVVWLSTQLLGGQQVTRVSAAGYGAALLGICWFHIDRSRG